MLWLVYVSCHLMSLTQKLESKAPIGGKTELKTGSQPLPSFTIKLPYVLDLS